MCDHDHPSTRSLPKSWKIINNLIYMDSIRLHTNIYIWTYLQTNISLVFLKKNEKNSNHVRFTPSHFHSPIYIYIHPHKPYPNQLQQNNTNFTPFPFFISIPNTNMGIQIFILILLPLLATKFTFSSPLPADPELVVQEVNEYVTNSSNFFKKIYSTTSINLTMCHIFIFF